MHSLDSTRDKILSAQEPHTLTAKQKIETIKLSLHESNMPYLLPKLFDRPGSLNASLDDTRATK